MLGKAINAEKSRERRKGAEKSLRVYGENEGFRDKIIVIKIGKASNSRITIVSNVNFEAVS